MMIPAGFYIPQDVSLAGHATLTYQNDMVWLTNFEEDGAIAIVAAGQIALGIADEIEATEAGINITPEQVTLSVGTLQFYVGDNGFWCNADSGTQLIADNGAWVGPISTTSIAALMSGQVATDLPGVLAALNAVFGLVITS